MVKYQDIDFLDCDILLKEKWDKQTDASDFDTGFIYYCKRYMQVVELAEANDVDLIVATHRWYNFVCSKAVEEIFCELGARAERNVKDKYTDFYINDIPFDVKVSVVPANYPECDLTKRVEKNKLIKWLYENQSQEGRKHDRNRLFIICKGKTYFDSLWMKHDFTKIKAKVKAFLDYTISKNTFNEVELSKNVQVLSDIIYIS